jgi:hypothetical protein
MMDYAELHRLADEAGNLAAEALRPVPMVVGQAKSLFSNEIDTSKPTYFVADGVCGFAWVKFKGNTPWARWAKKAGLARSSYPSGLQISVHAFNQSMQKKEAYAQAYARVLNDHGIEAYADSRLD